MTSNLTKLRHRGAALLELCFTLSILLVITFGTIEFGQFFYLKNQVQGAAREGARAAMISGAVNSDVDTAITQVMTAAGLQGTGYTVDVSPVLTSSTAAGTPVTVAVTIDWSAVPDVYKNPLSIPMPNKQIRGVAVMRRE